ncbi:hypothetical protein PanWU01x14_058960 [Parasponia andersonii]|uniref:Uncharacterized protein n=1 Tax=Parasponia andersonii TaxID=3476 RepID=A0A2P5DJB0_PARAD|nr:hypothetical protein PanWU01x14_058960 [Parasponia andersonii]
MFQDDVNSQFQHRIKESNRLITVITLRITGVSLPNTQSKGDGEEDAPLDYGFYGFIRISSFIRNMNMITEEDEERKRKKKALMCQALERGSALCTHMARDSP